MTAGNQTPAVSVLVTVYNRDAYLAQCLDSILASKWQDFEVIVVDDQSSDGSVEIAERYAARDRRIRFSRNESNLGDYSNRLRAAKLARGAYLKYVDSDDLVYPHSLAVMVEAMVTHPDAALGLAHSMPEDEEPYPWKLSPEAAWRKQFLGRGCLNCGPTGTIIRRDAFFDIGGFRDWGVLNDTDLWYRMSARWPVVLLPPGLVWWRRHDDQEFSKNGATMTYLEKGFQLGMDALASSDCPLNPAERGAAIARLSSSQARRLLSWALRNRMPLRALDMAVRSGIGLGDLVNAFRRER